MMLAVISPMSQLSQPYFNPPDAAAHTTAAQSPLSTAAPRLFSRPAIIPSRRPRLTVNTSLGQEKVFGKKSTSLRLDALSATTPTARNTLKNTYDSLNTVTSASANSPQRVCPRLEPREEATASSSTSSNFISPASSYARASHCGTASSASISSVSSHECLGAPEPQSLDSSKSSNLSDKRTDSSKRRSIANMSDLAAPRPSFQRKHKRVSFRDPLAEEIVTTKYTFAHSDIGSEETSPVSAGPFRRGSGMVEQHPSAGTRRTLSPTTKSTAGVSSTSFITTSTTSLPQESTIRADSQGDMPNISSFRRLGNRNTLKRDSDESGSDGDTFPETPISSRRKRRCEWVWTLGPVGKAEAEIEPSEDGSASPCDAC